MKRLLSLLLLLSADAFAQNNPAFPAFLGFRPPMDGGTISTTTIALDAADGGDSDSCSDDLIAYSIQPSGTVTIDKFRIYLTAVASTLGANDLVVEMFASDGAAPTGSALVSYNTLTGGAPVGAGWIEWAGFNDAITRGSQYWMVVKNCNATPTTNFPTIARITVFTTPIQSDGGSGLSYRCSSDGGTGWSVCSSPNTVPPMAIEFGSGTGNTSAGMPYHSITAPSSTGSANRAYDTQEAGVYFTTPADTRHNAIGISCLLAKVSTPSAGLRYRWYNNTTLQASTDTKAENFINTSVRWRTLYFSSTQVIPANTVVRVVASAAATGDASTTGYAPAIATSDSDTETLALRPYGVRKTILTGGSWTETNTETMFCTFVLDNGDLYPSVSAYSSVPNMNGGFQ
jgi:hypothetical protein